MKANVESTTSHRKRELSPHLGALSYSVHEAARMIGVSRAFIYSLIAEGKLQSFKLKGKRLIARSALEQLITEATEES